MRPIALGLALLIAVGTPAPAMAYLKFGVRIGSTTVDVRWPGPVSYFVNERGTAEIGPTQLRDVIGRAFATWAAVPTSTIEGTFVGFTTLPPGLQDQRTTFGFLDRPDLDRVLGATSFLLDATTGEIREADVFFNTRFTWSDAPSGEAGRIDLESVALHEIGHLLGLGHSAIGETELASDGGRRVLGSGAVMFPIAFSPGSIADRQLQPDDVAGISHLYPADGFAEATGSIGGRVTNAAGGVFGAHIAAIHLESGTLIGGFSLNSEGEFAIAGLPPGAYLLRAEPLDDADPESFFNAEVDVDFAVTYASRVVIAPEGGGSTDVRIEVRDK